MSSTKAKAEEPIELSPFCASLCSKKVLLSRGLPMTEADVLDGSNWIWCARTHQILGPDREVASAGSCRKGRGCFHSPFEPLL